MDEKRRKQHKSSDEESSNSQGYSQQGQSQPQPRQSATVSRESGDDSTPPFQQSLLYPQNNASSMNQTLSEIQRFLTASQQQTSSSSSQQLPIRFVGDANFATSNAPHAATPSVSESQQPPQPSDVSRMSSTTSGGSESTSNAATSNMAAMIYQQLMEWQQPSQSHTAAPDGTQSTASNMNDNSRNNASGNVMDLPPVTSQASQNAGTAPPAPSFDPHSLMASLQQQQQQQQQQPRSQPQPHMGTSNAANSTSQHQLLWLQSLQQPQQQPRQPPQNQPPPSVATPTPSSESSLAAQQQGLQQVLTRALQGSGNIPNNDPTLASAAAMGISQLLFAGGGGTTTTTANNNSNNPFSLPVLQGILQAVQQQQQPQQQQQQTSLSAAPQQAPQQAQVPTAFNMNPFASWSTAAAAATGSAAPTPTSWQQQQQQPQAVPFSTGDMMNAQTTSDLVAALTEQANSSDGKRKRRPYHHESFPSKLHRLLTETEEAEQDDIVSFNLEGTAILIHQPDVFEEEIIPKYFRHSKLSSFKRQLSMYGFTRILDGPDTGGFIHPLFRKGQPELSKDMERVS